MSETFLEVERILRKRLHADERLLPETNLVADLGLDSLRQLELVVELENHFEVCLEEGDEEGIETVADLLAVLRSRLG